MAMITPVDPLDDRAIYKQIADQLRDLIEAGVLPPGGKLPSESALMKRFGTSRQTIRNGLDELAREGRVYSRRGVGVFVSPHATFEVDAPQRLVMRDPVKYLRHDRMHADDEPRFIPEDARRQGFDYDSQSSLRVREVEASARVANLLGIGAGTPVFARERVVRLRPSDDDGHLSPAKIANSYLPLDVAVAAIREVDTGPGGTYARIEEAGHALTHFDEQLVFRMPDPTERWQLRLGPGVPVIDHTRVAWSGERPVECFLSVLAGDKYEFEYQIPVDRGGSTEAPAQRPIDAAQQQRRGPSGRQLRATDITGGIDVNRDRPIYKQIADLVRERIDAGDFAAGDRLPSEAALMRRFEVTRTTVRRALNVLAVEGRIRTERGVGAFVKEVVRADAFVRQPYDRLARDHYHDEGVSPIYIDAATRGLQASDVHQDRVRLAEVAAPTAVARRLGLEVGAPVFRRSRRIRMGGLPTQLTDTYHPLDVVADVETLREEHTGPGGTHAVIERAGHRLTHFVEHLSVRMPDPREVRRLRLDDGVPVVDLYQTAHTAERPVECFHSVIAGDRYVFTYRIDAA